MKVILMLIVLALANIASAEYATFASYTQCMAERSSGSFMYQFKYHCDNDCQGAYLGFQFKQSFSKDSNCKLARNFQNSYDFFSILTQMPGGAIEACQVAVGYPANESAQKVIEIENNCYGIGA